MTTGYPTTPKKVRLCGRRRKGNEVIVLSAFDGIGAGPWLTWDLVGQPRAIISWEVDRAAIQIVDYHIPDVRHRGDITEDDPTKVATELKSIDPDGQCMVLFIACQDFSRIGDRAGHQAERGYLFNFAGPAALWRTCGKRGDDPPTRQRRPSTGRRSTGTPPPARSGHGPCTGAGTGCNWTTPGRRRPTSTSTALLASPRRWRAAG